MTNLVKKIEKFYGHSGLWFCTVEKCDHVFTSNDLQKWDKLGQLSWGLLARDAKIATPICPLHGVLLEYDPEIDEDNDEWDIIQEVAAISGNDLIPYNPLSNADVKEFLL